MNIHISTVLYLHLGCKFVDLLYFKAKGSNILNSEILKHDKWGRKNADTDKPFSNKL
jgi:hypothetical protein